MQKWIDKDKITKQIIDSITTENGADLTTLGKVVSIIDDTTDYLSSENCDLLKTYAQPVIHYTDDYKDYYMCPVCQNEDGIVLAQSYCECCGQKIYWQTVKHISNM